VALATGERRRVVYVGLTRAKDELYVTATREEQSSAEVEVGDQDHFAEILSWALAHTEEATVVEAEQLELPAIEPTGESRNGTAAVVDEVLDSYELVRPRPEDAKPRVAPELELSFSDLHDFELCPVRYRFRRVWGAPAPPDELLNRAARDSRSSELGAAVHAALAAWHAGGPDTDLHALYAGPESGVPMLERYAAHPLARARTLGVEVEFNLRLAGARVRGLVDRVCEMDGRTILIDYKTNASLDDKLRAAYTLQLRLYRLAAGRGLLPGGTSPDLVLFDMRRGEAITITPDDAAVEDRVAAVVGKITARDFALGPEHAERPCVLCAYRPICKDRR
jgi:ATP-dependent exoDNAse (exonuclease V) beta subunit